MNLGLTSRESEAVVSWQSALGNRDFEEIMDLRHKADGGIKAWLGVRYMQKHVLLSLFPSSRIFGECSPEPAVTNFIYFLFLF